MVFGSSPLYCAMRRRTQKSQTDGCKPDVLKATPPVGIDIRSPLFVLIGRTWEEQWKERNGKVANEMKTFGQKESRSIATLHKTSISTAQAG